MTVQTVENCSHKTREDFEAGLQQNPKSIKLGSIETV